MSEDDPHEVVERGYDQVTKAYAGLELKGREWPRARKLRELLVEVPEGGTVLDVGCGNGVPAIRMIQESHHGVGVDANGATRQTATEDILWSLLNSAEFVFNH